MSHQWAANRHPDPTGEKLKVLQEALGNILAGKAAASPAVEVEMLYGRVSPYSKAKLSSVHIYIWYDYFSVPQFNLEDESLNKDVCVDQPKAIASIPGYIAACEFFVALCPTMRHADTSTTLNRYTWQKRGWCLSEKMTRELAKREGLILLIESPKQLSLLQAWDSLYYSPGDGDFTVESDRIVVAKIMKDMLQHTLQMDLSRGDLQNYRFYLHQQQVRFRHCETPALEGLLPSIGEDSLAEFLHQSGFRSFDERDADGWSPLCYAAVQGSTELVSALLSKSADPNTVVSKSIRRLYTAKNVPVVSLCAAFGNNEALRLLLDSRADPNQKEGRGNPPLFYPSLADNVEGARILLKFGADPCYPDVNIRILGMNLPVLPPKQHIKPSPTPRCGE